MAERTGRCPGLAEERAMPEPIRLLLFDYTVRTVALGAAVLGIVSGVLGCYAGLRRQSLFGDARWYAPLPGVCVAFLLSGGTG